MLELELFILVKLFFNLISVPLSLLFEKYQFQTMPELFGHVDFKLMGMNLKVKSHTLLANVC